MSCSKASLEYRDQGGAVMRHATATATTALIDAAKGPMYKRCRENLPPLPDVVKRLVLLLDGSRSLQHACEETGLPLHKAEAAVEKLARMGVLTTLSTTATRTETSDKEGSRPAGDGFSPEEEAFFASEVEPIDMCNEPFVSLSERFDLWFSDLMLRLRGSTAM
jgi:hypothetical protein